MNPIVFLDTETTSLAPDRRVWEFGGYRRDDTGEHELHLFVTDVDLTDADQQSLKIGGFYERHPVYKPVDRAQTPVGLYMSEAGAAERIERFTRGAMVVGCVPDFDTECLAAMLRRHKLSPAWHYHKADIESMAAGWLAASGDSLAPPWHSDNLSRQCGIDPPGNDERHTACGDARWVMRWWDRIMGTEVPEAQPW